MSGWGPRVHSLRPHGKPLWWGKCQTNSRADPLSNLFNCVLALREDPAWAGAIRYDEMLRESVLAATGNPIGDADVHLVHLWMQEQGLERMPLDIVREAVEIVAREHAFHPIRDWLAGLVWDGVPRLADWLHTFVGCADDEYHRLVSTLFLTAMVARVYEPGCQCDYTLVLEGPQRRLKSSLCAVLAGGDRYFTDNLPELSADKDVSAQLGGKWVVEIAELAAFQRADNEKLKAFLTRRIERYRPAYGRKRVFEPRQGVFIGTTNKFVWMKDETGGSRFWPVRCGRIDLDGLRQNREQLFAEAVEHYYTTRRWWPETVIEDALFAPQQDQRYEGDAWEKTVTDWDRCTVDTPTGMRVALSVPFYLIDIAQGAIGILPERFGVREQRRLTSVLEYLGWSRAPRTKRGIPWNPV